MKAYVGVRLRDGPRVFRVTKSAFCEPLDPRYDLRHHTPDGFAWRYAGSAPAQLALALLADASGDDEYALDHYLNVKGRLVARLTESVWRLSSEEIMMEAEKD